VNAIVLAGGTEQDQLALQHGYPNKALLPINDLPMITYVVNALQRCACVEQVVVVGPMDSLSEFLPADIKLLPEVGNAVENVLAAIKLLPQDRKILICTSDIPLITPEALSSLFEATRDREADLYYPIISQERCVERYPGVKRTYVKLRDGSFTGGNIFIVNPSKVTRLASIFSKLVEARKNPAKMCLTLGLPGVFLVAKLALGWLTVRELEIRVSRILGIVGEAIDCGFPEVGTDVDKDSDLELARKVLAAG
jgi:GTP:adenosylcobinamide-phosphate guanylyltransferase